MLDTKSFTFRFDDIEVRERGFCLVRSGEPTPVEPKAFRVLLILLRNPGKVIAKDELLQAVWGDTAVTENSLARSIALLRRLLGDETRNPRFIETVATVGYRFVRKVEISEDAAVQVSDLSSGESAEPGEDDVQLAADPASRDEASGEFVGEGHDQTENRRRALGRWLFPPAFLLVCLTIAVWYLHRPLPPLRIAQNGYVQITHDGRMKSLAGTDGSRLYFTRGSLPQPVAEVAISGGGITAIPTTLPGAFLQDVSPDGSSLLVTSFDGGPASLWSLQIPSGSLRPLLRDVGVPSAAWSSDGKSVVYSTGSNEIYLIGSDGTGNRKIADVGAPASTITWSPDGSKIRFFKDSRLWEMSSDGSGLHPLLQNWRPASPLCCGHWTPDGKFFVFLLTTPSRGSILPGNQLWALDERRSIWRRVPSEPVQLTSGPILWNTPIPSKDGTKIFAQGIIQRGELVRFDARSQRLEPWLGGISAESVLFSPDGQFLAYVTFPDGVLWRANRDGSNAVQLTDPPMHPIVPRWSPDGAQILFTQVGEDGHFRSYTVSSQGGGTPKLLLPEEKGGTGDGYWSPDGRKIVFSSLQSGEAIPSLKYVLRVLDLGTHQITTLPRSEGTFSPRWSPNGRFISGIHIGAPGGLDIFDFETQRWSLLPEKGECDYHTWSSDSRFIYFWRSVGEEGVFRVRVSDGVEERVVDLKGFHPTGAAGGWFGLDPEDTPILIRDVGTADIYALTLEEK